jgi:hypothetical protein
MNPQARLTRRQSAKLALAAALPAVLLTRQTASAEDNLPGDDQVQYLFVQNAKGVSFAEGKMTLKDINDITILFSDRPDRIAGHMTTADFARNWNMGKDSFKIDNPNAALAIFGEKEPNDAVVELSDPVLENGNLTYSIRILEGSIPKTSGECSLFIDLIGRPLTPVSYAGVARRTTRRVVRRY